MFGLGSAPVYLGGDESHFAVGGYAIATSGRDLNGDLLPLFFNLTDPQDRVQWANGRVLDSGGGAPSARNSVAVSTEKTGPGAVDTAGRTVAGASAGRAERTAAHDSTRALAAAIRGVAQRCGFCSWDFFTHYQLRSAFYYDSVAFASVASRLTAAPTPPAIYLRRDLDAVWAKWRFYATEAGQPGLLTRTTYFSDRQGWPAHRLAACW